MIALISEADYLTFDRRAISRTWDMNSGYDYASNAHASLLTFDCFADVHTHVEVLTNYVMSFGCCEGFIARYLIVLIINRKSARHGLGIQDSCKVKDIN